MKASQTYMNTYHASAFLEVPMMKYGFVLKYLGKVGLLQLRHQHLLGLVLVIVAS
jgi:hypothetical protein